LGLRVNPPSSQVAGRAPHLEMPGSAGGRAMKSQGSLKNTCHIIPKQWK
jgi:hypothetical protein